MKIDTISKALRHYLLTGPAQEFDRIEETMQALEECAASADRAKLETENFYLIPDIIVDSVLNRLTYDAYGKRARFHTNKVPLSHYIGACNEVLNYAENLPHFIFEGTHSFFQDLWRDNEDEGCNTSLGTFLGCVTYADFVHEANRCIERLQELCKDAGAHTHSIKICIDDQDFYFYNSAALTQELLSAIMIARDQL